MKLKTRFNIDQKVFFMDENKISFFIVRSIELKYNSYHDNNNPQQQERYSDDHYGMKNFIKSELLFPEIEDLLKNLEKNIKM